MNLGHNPAKIVNVNINELKEHENGMYNLVSILEESTKEFPDKEVGELFYMAFVGKSIFTTNLIGLVSSTLFFIIVFSLTYNFFNKRKNA